MRTAACACLFLLLAACPKRPIDFGKDGEPKDAADLLLRVRLAELSVTSVKGDAKLKASTDQGSGSAGLFVAVDESGKLHLEALDFFGRPQAALTSDGSKFGLYDAQAGKYFTGPARAANLSRLLPIALPIADLSALLLGRVPRADAEPSAMTFDRDRGVFVVTLGTQTVEIEPPSYRVVKSNARQYSVVMGDIETVGHVTFPKHALLESHGTRMDLSWKELELNAPIDPSTFDLTPPENVPQEEVRGGP